MIREVNGGFPVFAKALLPEGLYFNIRTEGKNATVG